MSMKKNESLNDEYVKKILINKNVDIYIVWTNAVLRPWAIKLIYGIVNIKNIKKASIIVSNVSCFPIIMFAGFTFLVIMSLANGSFLYRYSLVSIVNSFSNAIYRILYTIGNPRNVRNK